MGILRKVLGARILFLLNVFFESARIKLIRGPLHTALYPEKQPWKQCPSKRVKRDLSTQPEKPTHGTLAFLYRYGRADSTALLFMPLFRVALLSEGAFPAASIVGSETKSFTPPQKL